MRNKVWIIYSITPISNIEDDYRIVEIFDTKKDAESVLEALEKVNLNFKFYKIIKKEI